MPTQHFLIHGRVQGVGFRWFVHREAAEIGLRGWVKNTDAGDVEIVASGPDDRLAELDPRAPQRLARLPRRPRPRPRLS